MVCSLDSPMNQNKNHEYDFEMKLDIFQKINHFLKERELCPAVVPLPNTKHILIWEKRGNRKISQ